MSPESNARLNEDLDDAIRLTDGMLIDDREKLSGRRGQTFEAPLSCDRPLRRILIALTHLADAEGRAPSYGSLHDAIDAAVKKYSELMATVPPQFARRPWLEEGRRGAVIVRQVSLFGYPALLTCTFDDATGEHVVRLRSLHADPIKSIEDAQLGGIATLASNLVKAFSPVEPGANMRVGNVAAPVNVGVDPAQPGADRTVAAVASADEPEPLICCIYFVRRTAPGDKDSIEHVAELQYRGTGVVGHDPQRGPRRGTGPTQLAALAQLLAGLLHDQ